ncbi:MAG TPA: HAMP domain-containing sensor histidine kinase, partial [Fluviicola sp.]|nr:HAMP domain-containing sensor histidine kinase [Fluviicola sp.]
HELQTPLAVAISKMELLLEKNELTEEQSQSLVEIMEIIERLVRLNKSLLHLTKIENKQFFDNKIINMREVVVQNLHDLEDLGSFKELKMDIKEIADLWVNMDESLAQTIVSNLMRNAIFHSPVKSTIQINVDSTFFQISNEAKHGALDLQKIYSRFYKSDENASSTGLGLAIVKAICDLYGFQIRYDFQENNHVFTVFMKK